MAAAAGVGLEGGSRLASTLEEAARRLQNLEDAGQAAGQLLEASAEADAPRRTGNLASHHQHTVVAGQVTVTNTAPYAAIVHASKPWLANTLDKHQADVLSLYAAAAADAVAQIEGT